MTACTFAKLDDRAVIRIAGEAARGFLHNIVTSNMAQVGETQAAYGALLTPQGKILFDFFIIGEGDGFLIDCAKARQADLVKRLIFYKLRAAVEISPADDMAVHALFGDGAAYEGLDTPGAAKRDGGLLVFVDPRVGAAGLRIIGPAAKAAKMAAGHGWTTGDLDTYHGHRIALGLADSGDIGDGAHFPHDCNFDQFGGVDFKKGCYVGQEVVSRMHHRGTARSRMVPVHVAAGGGDETRIEAGGKPAGTVLSRHGSEALAILRLDRLENALAAGEPVSLAGAVVTPRQPPWARFTVPGAKGAA